MNKTIAYFIFFILIQGAFANASDKEAVHSLVIKHSEVKSIKIVQDTLPKLVFVDNSLISFQNGIYKNRLDSIKKDVDLSYNRYVQKYIDTYINRKEHIGKMLGLSEYYFPIIEKALKEIGGGGTGTITKYIDQLEDKGTEKGFKSYVTTELKGDGKIAKYDSVSGFYKFDNKDYTFVLNKTTNKGTFEVVPD